MYENYPEKLKRDHKAKNMPRRSRWWAVLILIALNLFAVLVLFLMLISPIINTLFESIPGCTFG